LERRAIAVVLSINLFIIGDVMRRDLLTDLELMLLLAVLRVGATAYGVTIAREIEETGGRRVAIALVYSTLDRLQERGLVTSWTGDPSPERGGRAKRFFEVTRKGIRQIKATQAALTALWSGVPALKRREV
jgi:PadR family transcriptional regulator, regulatory protein PadR